MLTSDTKLFEKPLGPGKGKRFPIPVSYLRPTYRQLIKCRSLLDLSAQYMWLLS